MTRGRLKKLLKLLGLAAAAGFLLIQLVPAERTNPPIEADLEAPADIKAILRRACYDCHSHETRWPWYSYVAPTSWYVTNHVEEARGDLDFSAWPRFDLEAQAEALEEIGEQVSKGKMPLSSYLLLHRDARLDPAERERIVSWAKTGH